MEPVSRGDPDRPRAGALPATPAGWRGLVADLRRMAVVSPERAVRAHRRRAHGRRPAPGAIRRSASTSCLVTYALFAAAGLVSYVVSMQLFRRFLHRVAPRRVVLPVLLMVHGLCVVAMYLGRVVRLNSWDVVLAPGTVLASVLRVPHSYTVALLAVMFVVVGASAYVTYAVGDKALAQLRRVTKA